MLTDENKKRRLGFSAETLTVFAYKTNSIEINADSAIGRVIWLMG
jgi:hypothetical protein